MKIPLNPFELKALNGIITKFPNLPAKVNNSDLTDEQFMFLKSLEKKGRIKRFKNHIWIVAPP
jgi:hypothetical protein